MTEAEWLAADELWPMLLSLERSRTGRKLRLFAVACCRRIWPLIADPRCRSAVLVVEQFADDRATTNDLQAAEADIRAAWLKGPFDDAVIACLQASTSDVDLLRGALHAARSVIHAVWQFRREFARDGEPPRAYLPPIRPAEEAVLCELVREIFNPFRPAALEKGSQACHDGRATNLARAAYDDGAFDRLPILADALEDAGCTDSDLLGHFRGPGPHVRGCWALDLVLRKE
jgi:hypothetical protein